MLPSFFHRELNFSARSIFVSVDNILLSRERFMTRITQNTGNTPWGPFNVYCVFFTILKIQRIAFKGFLPKTIIVKPKKWIWKIFNHFYRTISSFPVSLTATRIRNVSHFEKLTQKYNFSFCIMFYLDTTDTLATKDWISSYNTCQWTKYSL